MSLDVIDDGAVPLDALAMLLREHGWTRDPLEHSLREIWWSPSRETSVVVPKGVYADYEQRVTEILAAVAQVSGRAPDEVELELARPFFVRFVTRTCLRSHVPAVKFRRSIELQEATLDAVTAAARSSSKAAPYHRGGTTDQVATYLDDVWTVPPSYGSFEVSAFLPRVPPPPEEQRVMFVAPDPAYVKVAVTLASGIEAATEMGSRWLSEHDDELFEQDEYQQRGVSANLLNALSVLGSGDDQSAEPFETRFVWVGDRPVGVKRDLLRVEPEWVPVFRRAAQALRGGPSEHWITHVGVVTRLSRRQQAGDGTVSVTGNSSELGYRTLSIELHEPDYRSATTAHRDGMPVVVHVRIRRDEGVVRPLRYDQFMVIQDERDAVPNGAPELEMPQPETEAARADPD